ncbi:hypothetical protein [Streptomyces sp. NPDC006193]|uniref:hypothetical protein n=1 Tax=Streptomyces sp. NPDC006193 TaxID=3155717 RepID=UPI0033A8B49A
MAAVLCAVAALLLGACGRERAGGTGGTSHLPWRTMAPTAVSTVRVGRDDRTLTIGAQVPGGGRACVRDLRAVVTDEVNGAVWVQVTFSSPSMDRRAGCPRERPATTRVRLPRPLGGRDVIVDHDAHFTRDGAEPPALRLCGPLGCRPPRTGCTTASYEQALKAVDAPDHTYPDARGCDGRWLVLDLTWRTGPVCGGASAPGCSSSLGDRWFFRAEKSGWRPFLRDTAGGCREVRRKEPAFPARLCASLPALPSSPRPGGPAASASPAV